MGLFRTVHASVACSRCASRFQAEVQFKTGADWQEEYREGDRADDLAPGSIYDGITDSHCGACAGARTADAIRAHCETLAAMAKEGSISLVTEAGLELVGAEIEATLGSLFNHVLDGVRPHRTGDLMELPGNPPLPPLLTILADGVRQWPLPAGANPWRAYQHTFWERLQAGVVERLVADGWSEEDGYGQEVSVSVAANHVLGVGAYDPAQGAG
jgi:hypothetical protein